MESLFAASVVLLYHPHVVLVVLPLTRQMHLAKVQTLPVRSLHQELGPRAEDRPLRCFASLSNLGPTLS